MNELYLYCLVFFVSFFKKYLENMFAVIFVVKLNFLVVIEWASHRCRVIVWGMFSLCLTSTLIQMLWFMSCTFFFFFSKSILSFENIYKQINKDFYIDFLSIINLTSWDFLSCCSINILENYPRNWTHKRIYHFLCTDIWGKRWQCEFDIIRIFVQERSYIG